MVQLITAVQILAIRAAAQLVREAQSLSHDLSLAKLAKELCMIDQEVVWRLGIDEDVGDARRRLRQWAEDAILDAGIAVEAVRLRGSSCRSAVRAVNAARVVYDEALASLPSGSERLDHIREDLTSLEGQIRPLREDARKRYQEVLTTR